MNCFLSCNIKSRDQKKYEELAGQIINERGKELGRATLAVNTGDKVVFFVLFFFLICIMILAHPPSQSQGVFATYHFSLLEATYRVKQQDKLIEWDTLTPKTQSNQRRANNCKGNRVRNYQSSLFKGYLLQGSFKQPKTRRRRCFPSFGNNPKRSKHFD